MLGYGISSAVRPLIAWATTWVDVLGVRLADRVGKGIRGAPRDALLAEWAAPGDRGRVFGFHRAMDHLGAVVGPLLAAAFLAWRPGAYRDLFAWTVVPGMVAVGLTLLVREQPRAPVDVAASTGTAALGNWRTDLPPGLWRFMLVLALFMLGSSSDAFLLLRLTDAAGTLAAAPLLWAALHVVKAATSFVGPQWSDRVGRRTVIAIGWFIYALVYAGFAASHAFVTLSAWFLVYGCYFGLAEGSEKALVADLAPARARGTAFGVYNAVQGVGALLASVLFGVIWTHAGAAVAFGFGAITSLAATALLWALVPAVESRTV